MKFLKAYFRKIFNTRNGWLVRMIHYETVTYITSGTAALAKYDGSRGLDAVEAAAVARVIQ